MQNKIFVFGSNEAGRHGGGAARYALQTHGARMGQGFGLAGNSFAIPTRDFSVRTLPFEAVEFYVKRFLEFANQNHHMTFQLTPIGCGLAGFSVSRIAPLFVAAPSNVLLPENYDDTSAHFTAVVKLLRKQRNAIRNPE